MLSKLQKLLFVSAAVATATLITVDTGVAAGPPPKFEVSLPRTARSPADLAAKVDVINNQNLSPWTVKGVVKNIGGHDFVGERLVTLQQVTGNYGPNGRRPKVVTLATMKLKNLKAGHSTTLQKVFTVQPAAGTRFQLVISPGDLHPDNDHDEKVWRGS
jgi:hypothetical protein